MKQFIYGVHAVLARLKQHTESIVEIYLDPKKENNPRIKPILDYAQLAQIGVQCIDFKAFPFLENARHQGVLAKINAVQKSLRLEDVLETAPSPKMFLGLDGITDPRNLGAILRVADGAGANAVIAPKDRSVGLNETAMKTASGAAESVPYIVVTNLARALRTLQENEIAVVGLAEEAQDNIYEADFPENCAFILGAEGRGLRHLTKKTCDFLVKIPMLGMVESLNVSVAAGVVLYEARRRLSQQQKQQQKKHQTQQLLIPFL